MTFELYLNPNARPVVPAAGFEPESRGPALTHASLPGFAATELRRSPRLAERLGVGTVLVKDESQRLGLPSFKILGASWATLTAIRDAWLHDPSEPLTLESVRSGLGDPAGRGLIAATDGNHGRGVARMAALLGLSCHILVPKGLSEARIQAIRDEGARVQIVDGTYDDAIVESARLADGSHLVVSDTSWEGYQRTPRSVVEGYSTMFYEIDDAIAEHGLPEPDVVVFQAGVGAFAAAGLRHYRSGRTRVPTSVIVEPDTANCLMASARAGRLANVPGPHPSSMAGLNCGLPSALVFPIIAEGTDLFLGIDDGYAEQAMRAYADDGIVAGESGAAGLGGLLALRENTELTCGLDVLRPDACVLFINTEGATDPGNYLSVVGRPAENVRDNGPTTSTHERDHLTHA